MISPIYGDGTLGKLELWFLSFIILEAGEDYMTEFIIEIVDKLGTLRYGRLYITFNERYILSKFCNSPILMN